MELQQQKIYYIEKKSTKNKNGGMKKETNRSKENSETKNDANIYFLFIKIKEIIHIKYKKFKKNRYFYKEK